MYRTPKLLALSLSLIMASGCATSKKAKEAAAVEAQAQQAADIAKAPTPEQKLGVLVTAYPELVGKPTRVVHTTDTLIVKEVQTVATIPTVSTPATDTALVRSVLAQLETAGHLVSKAQANALQQSLLPELAQRPRLSRDTARTLQHGLEIKAWVDKTGAVQIFSRKLQQQLPYPSITWDVTPQPVAMKNYTPWQMLGIVVKHYYWQILLILLFIIYLILRRSRNA